MSETLQSFLAPPIVTPRRRAPVDVTVIGAGPAGAMLAYLLAQQGWRVVLVEKDRLPRVKPCGGGLNRKTVALLPFSIDAVTERVVSRLVFTQSLRWPFARLSPEPLVSMVTRCAFDHFIVEKAAAAGACVYDACRVTHLEVQPQSLHVRADQADWHSRYLAFADGARGTLRRQLGFTEVATHDIGLDMDIEATPHCPWTPDTLYIDWGTHPQTYAWAFPKAEHWSIGVKGPVLRSAALVQYLRQFMQRWHIRPGPGKLRYLAHMLPTRHPGMPLVHGRALVLGDAAGLLEPFTGEGIYYAVRSAYLAAAALETASLSDAEPIAYTGAVEQDIMPDLQGARALQQLFDAWPLALHLLLRLHPRSWRAFAKLLGGERGFRDVQTVMQRYPRLVQSLLWMARHGPGEGSSCLPARRLEPL
jgi:geranylgeranyl reductase family protein